jgi:hypothetical protein
MPSMTEGHKKWTSASRLNLIFDKFFGKSMVTESIHTQIPTNNHPPKNTFEMQLPTSHLKYAFSNTLST